MSLQGKNPAAVLWNKVMTPLHEGLPDKNYDDPGGRRSFNYCMDSGYLSTDYCAMDPRGSRIASGSIFPESFPEGQECPYHTAETVITICVDCPVLNSDGSESGLFYQAGEFCPEESRKEICLPNFGREQLGTAVAGDAQWNYELASSYGTCTLHTSAPVVDPYDPFNPFNPTNPSDPLNPFNPIDPNEPSTNEPDDPGTVTDPGTTDVPHDPPPPPGVMVG